MSRELLAKYFNGQCTPSETLLVLEWLQKPEGQRYLEEELDRDIRFFDEFGNNLEYPDLDSEELFQKIQGNQRSVPFHHRSRRTSGTQWKAAAAIILVAGILSLFAGVLVGGWGSEEIVRTRPGERKTVILPDQSQIVLHSNSVLRYLTEFEKRKVFLEGEAYFEVEHNEKKPFVVYVDKSYVKVLGTKFVVSDYSGSGRVEVAVKTGRVELGSQESMSEDNEAEELSAREPENEENKPIEITDDEVGVQNRDSSPFLTDSTQSEELFDWVEGMMIFRDTPLKHVLSELENRYGVRCVLEDPEVAKQKFTSSFDDENLTEVLKVLTLSLDINYKRVGNKIYFSD